MNCTKKARPADARSANIPAMARSGFRSFKARLSPTGWRACRRPAAALWFIIRGPRLSSMTVITLTAGTIFVMWIGEQITERGVGNGISLIIMAGIVAPLAQRAQHDHSIRARR